MRHRGLPWAAAFALLLGACGAGGGPSPPELPPPPAVDASPVPANDPGSALPADWHKGAFMQVFVRSYQDSDGDGRGDLRGLIRRLDYLRDLGVTALWLMPVTRSQDGDHGYAVADYRAIEGAYGSLADFDELLRQAHARGMGVIVDYVINHSAAHNPIFANASHSPGNPWRDWYVWRPYAPAGWTVFRANPWRRAASGSYYAAFSPTMPDFNLANPAVVEYHKSNLRFWLNRGVDGFRFDAVGVLFENGPAAWENQPRNYALMAEMRALVEGYARRFMVCEGPGDPRGFAAGSACGSAFAFDLNRDIVRAARGEAAGVKALAAYFESAPPGIATFLSNHDRFAGERPWDALGGDAARLKLAAAAYLLAPGSPFIYYGEEVGMSAAPLAGDPGLRAPMSWTGEAPGAGFTAGTPYRALAANAALQNVAAENARPAGLLAFYKAMLALRRARPSLARGGYEGAFASGLVLGYQRALASERTLVLLNFGDAAATATARGLPPGASLSSLYPADAARVPVDAGGAAIVGMPPRSVRVLAVAP